MKTEFTMRNVAIRRTVKPNMNEESETARIGMNNINIEFPRGVDASQSNVPAPVIINEAEKSALVVKARCGTEHRAGSNIASSLTATGGGEHREKGNQNE